MSIADRARDRGITEILHYTPQQGVLGSIIKGNLLSRARLQDDEEVAYIFEEVWPIRAPEWADHISLSVSRINADLYRRSKNNHPDWWWAVMSFDVEILDHDNVWFTTTNNIYEDTLRRGQGAGGFEDMFSDTVPWGYYGTVSTRSPSTPDSFTTNRAAEVLYPGALSLDHLRHLYVPGQQHQWLVNAWCETYNRPDLPVEVSVDVFT